MTDYRVGSPAWNAEKAKGWRRLPETFKAKLWRLVDAIRV